MAYAYLTADLDEDFDTDDDLLLVDDEDDFDLSDLRYAVPMIRGSARIDDEIPF